MGRGRRDVRGTGPGDERAGGDRRGRRDGAVVFPVAAVREAGVLAADRDRAADVGGEPIVATVDPPGDVAAYGAPPLPVDREGDALVDADGRRWTVAGDALVGPDGATRDRVAGRRGLWFALRVHYEETAVVDGE